MNAGIITDKITKLVFCSCQHSAVDFKLHQPP